MNFWLCKFAVIEVRHKDKTPYAPDTLFKFVVGCSSYLKNLIKQKQMKETEEITKQLTAEKDDGTIAGKENSDGMTNRCP